MPLPLNTSLSLLGASRPGDAMPSKPKVAMLIRLSSETLDALESSSTQVQFDFGDNPGLYVGQTHFPMGATPENTHHELYLRASSATKKTAPLKLYANVVGKFTIKEREIANELRDKIRESTQDAVAQRNSRTTVFMETPPDTQPTGKKRKEAPSNSMFRKPLRAADKVKPTPMASTPPPVHKPSLSSSSSTGQSGVPLRRRLVHCLAQSEKSEEQLFKMLGASDRNSPHRPVINDLLEQLAELKQSSDKSHKMYLLKPVGWKEVRPFEWPGFSESERIQMARTARLKLKDLRIPETDPIWVHFQFKNPSSSSTETSRPSTSGLPIEDKAPKRGISSQEVKEKKAKPKADPRAEIKMKDESSRPVSRPSPRPSDIRNPDPSGSDPRIRSQLPSTSKSLKAPPRDVPRAPSPRERPAPPRQEPSTKSSTSQLDERSLQSQKVKKMRRESNINASDSERERAPPRAQERPPRKHVNDGDYPDSKSSSTKRRAPLEDGEYIESKSAAKRKAIDPDDDTYQSESVRPKKRKTDQHSITSSVSREDRDRDRDRRESGLPKKPVADPRLAERDAIPRTSSAIPKNRKPSPPVAVKRNHLTHSREPAEPPAPSRSHSSTTTSSKAGKVSQPVKARRRSPVYTSSSEEEKDDLPLSKRPPTKVSASIHSATPRTNPSRPLPTDHASLRARYNSSYLDYLNVLNTLMLQRGKLDTLLRNEDLGRAGSITDSEGDVELLSSEEIETLVGKHKRLHDELDSIQKIFDRTKVEPTSD